MESRYVDFAEGNESNESGEVRRRLGGQAFLDITDRKVRLSCRRSVYYDC